MIRLTSVSAFEVIENVVDIRLLDKDGQQENQMISEIKLDLHALSYHQ